MKKFSFSLDNVLVYKNQVLSNLKNEHGKAIARVIEQENKIETLNRQYFDLNKEYNEKNSYGITIIEASGYKAYLKTIENKIKEAVSELEHLKKLEEEKRKEVVGAKIETSSIDKLKEKKVEQYNKQIQKSEEIFIEEFVANCRFASE